MLRDRLSKTAVVIVAFFFLTTPLFLGTGYASSTASVMVNEQGDVDINFDNAPLREVINAISRITGKNFLIDDAVKGNVTIIASTKIPQKEVFKVFESILELKGYNLVPAGEVIKVMPSRTALKKSVPISIGKGADTIEAEDRLITRLIPIEYAAAGELTAILTPLASDASHMTAYSPTNTIIVTDTASNIQRILTVIEEVDIAGFEQNVTIIPLENASADVLAQEIQAALIEAGPSRAPRRPRTPRPRGEAAPTITPSGAEMKIIPDLRTNSLIVVANERDAQQVRALVKQLDQPTPVEKNNIHIYMLSNSNAEDVSGVLNNLVGAQPTAPTSGRAAEVAAGGIRAFYKAISIVPDAPTNSLIVIATPQDYAVLQEVIDTLDQPRAQVLVEALIAEVSMTFMQEIGIQWFAVDRGDLSVGVKAGEPGLGVPDVGALVDPPSGVPADMWTGIALSQMMPDGLMLGGFDSDTFAILTARENDSDFNVVSAPHLMTLDNQKAIINISEEVPFIQTQRTETGGTTGLPQLTTFEYKDVGVSLEITPHISKEGFVRLDLVQAVSDKQTVFAVTGTEVASQFKRETETTVVVKDKHMIVIGGLIKESDTVNITKVPFLGDIPVLGWVFKSRKKEREKKNLLIFIRPTIVRSPLQVAELTEQKKGEVLEKLREKIGEIPGMGGPAAQGESPDSGSGASRERGDQADSSEELILRPPLEMGDEDAIREAMPE